ncbi:MAG: MBL fold metallo-hydrolase [Alphaproteobacteria bacterium]|nr:MBL fold metallo-hydrolase [Alphaproteobacteria bacterium]
MAGGDPFFVRFWGVRGSIAVPGPSTARYGGNTSCLEIRCGSELLIFDAGTGLRPLGNSLAPNGAVDADLFLTHTHFDHVNGLPFFVPMFIKGNRFRLWAGHLIPQYTLKYVLSEMMIAPLFPAPVEVFQADISYHDFNAGETLHPKRGVALRTAALNHPNNATGYRVEYGGKSICYITDTEHYVDRIDERVVDLVRGADLMIYDGTYTDQEYPRFKGWGHSTWQQGIAVANAAGVKTYVIFHHDPSHDDAFMDKIQAEAEAARPGTLVAREGMTLSP